MAEAFDARWRAALSSVQNRGHGQRCPTPRLPLQPIGHMSEAKCTGSVAGFFEMPLGALADTALEAIVMVDRQQTIVAMNAAACRTFGYVSSEILGQPVSRLIPERFHVCHAAHLRRFAAGGEVEPRPIRRDPVLGRRANGEEFPAEASISRVDLTDPAGRGGPPRPYFVAVLRDLSVERGLRQEVANLTERMRAVLELAPVAIWIVEGERVAFANRAASQLLGGPAGDSLVGLSVYALMDPPSHDALRAHLAQVLAGGAAAAALHGRILRRDGAVRDVEMASAALPDHGRTVVQMVVTDITERKRQLQEQRRQREALRRLSASVVDAREEERRRIARELHDELGQRLTALKMGLASLRPPGAALCDESRIRGLFEMIDDTVAAVRRISADLRPLMLDDLGLNAAIDALAQDVGRRTGLKVSVRLGTDDPPVSDSAAIALYRMVQEALTNVSRHAQAHAVQVELQQRGAGLVLTVRDDGVGFSERALQHENRYGLLGIRERALALGGRLEVDNPAGGGARITVHLPLQPAAAAPEVGA